MAKNTLTRDFGSYCQWDETEMGAIWIEQCSISCNSCVADGVVDIALFFALCLLTTECSSKNCSISQSTQFSAQTLRKRELDDLFRKLHTLLDTHLFTITSFQFYV
mmetsp:Transcript_49652/g.56956  ORF Transcript_49652/g.56956 Transcript_49652/m.56956 type:complete len:106 (+) Transcript_49652:448-765(+)